MHEDCFYIVSNERREKRQSCSNQDSVYCRFETELVISTVQQSKHQPTNENTRSFYAETPRHHTLAYRVLVVGELYMSSPQTPHKYAPSTVNKFKVQHVKDHGKLLLGRHVTISFIISQDAEQLEKNQTFALICSAAWEQSIILFPS